MGENEHQGEERRRKRRHRGLSPEQAYAVLGLSPGARGEEIRSAFRRLALEHHPDHHPDDPSHSAQFARIAEAYRSLEARLDVDADPNLEGECARCGKYGPLLTGLDNTRCCAACLSSINGGRILPGPPIVIASCGFALTVLLFGAFFLLASVGDGGRYLTAAFICGAVGLLSLAVTAVNIAYVARPRRRR